MIQRRQNLGFALKSREPFRILCKGCGQNLDCYFAVELRVFGSINLTHSTRANGRKDFIGSDFASGTHLFFSAAVQF
jgi:hypothetical protein